MSTPPGNPSAWANVTPMASDTSGTDSCVARPIRALPSASWPTVELDGTESWLSTETDEDVSDTESVEREK
jgi:hypothetical protein